MTDQEAARDFWKTFLDYHLEKVKELEKKEAKKLSYKISFFLSSACISLELILYKGKQSLIRQEPQIYIPGIVSWSRFLIYLPFFISFIQ